MRKRYWLRGMQLIALLVVAVLCTDNSQAQFLNRKKLPTLTLVKQVGNPNTDVLSDPVQYVAEPGAGEKRIFLLPVYIKNCLDSINNPITGVSAEPLYSFRFKLQYNRTLLHAIGVQKRGPLPIDTYVAAKDFNLSWDVKQDIGYKSSTTGAPSLNGERIMVTGSSTIPLPLPKLPNALPNQNTCQFRDTAVFLYIAFEVVGNSQGGSSGATRDQMILTRDSISWNNYSIVDVDQNMINRAFDPIQEGVAPSPIFPITYPNNYGAAVVEITQRPRIDLLPPSQVVRVGGNFSLYELTHPIQTQYGNPNFIARQILLVNGVAGTFLRNLTVESDEPWLRVDLNNPPQEGGNPPDRGTYIRSVGQQQIFNIVATPNLLPTDPTNPGYPTPGTYVGYITIRSDDAINSAVRLKVILIVNRNPLEPSLQANTEPTQTRGIRLLFRNSATDTTYLTFGTGVGARDSVDTLFGEAEAGAPPNPNQFYARFFPPSLGINFNGMIDTRGVTPLSAGNESSIDIRDFNINKTLVYCVKFSAGGTQKYPVTIEYDTRDFPNGAQLFIRDNINGQAFNTNLRDATITGPTTRSFTIVDPKVTGFCIEYTLPDVTQFPEIRRGWNLVSLPVEPSDSRSGVVFPNMISGKPIYYAHDLYDTQDTVRVGVGYFVKYGSLLDKLVSGVLIKEINEDPLISPYRVRVYQGWNTLGGLSVQTTTEKPYMDFGPIAGQGAPNRVGEVYRYLTDRGYEQTSLITPGYGYWVNVDRDGYYRLKAPPGAFKASASSVDNAYSVLNRLSVADNAQKVGTAYFGQNASIENSRYELPPLPASDMFDVRFNNNAFVSASSDVAAEHVVHFQGVTYPVVLSVANADADYVVSDAVTGQVFGTFRKGEPGAVRITNSLTKSVKITGVAVAEMSLGNAFPNPTSTKASFDFSVPTEQNVTITLHNALGNEVRQLFNGNASGKQTVEFSTEGLPTGVYYYTMNTSSGFSQVRRIVVSR
jgi:hypothetical protein